MPAERIEEGAGMGLGRHAAWGDVAGNVRQGSELRSSRGNEAHEHQRLFAGIF